MKPKFANSKPLYYISGMTNRPDLVFTTIEDARKFAANQFTLDTIVAIKPVKIVIGLEEDETDRLMAEKKALEDKLVEVKKKLELENEETQSCAKGFAEFMNTFL